MMKGGVCLRLALVFSLVLFPVTPLDNGLASKPPMGWLSWERFRCNVDCSKDPQNCISENLLKTTAQAMVQDGYRQAGYRYVVLDDCWPARQRDDHGRLRPDPIRFPSGFSALADYIHSLDLKFGVYEDVGLNTCKGYPGCYGHYQVDAGTMAAWKVDYLKLDGCAINASQIPSGYKHMGSALNKTGRHILYSCEWPLAAHNRGVKSVNMTEVVSTCNTWRVARDIQNNWRSILKTINAIGSQEESLLSRAGPGSWLDADQIVVGNGALSPDQERVQMGMWAIMASPILVSADLRDMNPRSRSLLQNKRVIAINQDPLGIPGRRIKLLHDGVVQLWRRPVSPKGSFAIAFLNTSHKGHQVKVKVKLEDVGMDFPGGYILTEVFDGRYLGQFSPHDTLSVPVNTTGIYFIRALVGR